MEIHYGKNYKLLERQYSEFWNTNKTKKLKLIGKLSSQMNISDEILVKILKLFNLLAINSETYRIYFQI